MADEDHVTRIAKALCVVDGHNPEVHIYFNSEAVKTAGVVHHREIMGPAWMSYLAKARCLVAANVAAGIVDLSDDLGVDHPHR